MTELLVGTKKGLFVLEGESGSGAFEVTARAFAGESVEYAMRDPRAAGCSRRSPPGSTARGVVRRERGGEWEQAGGWPSTRAGRAMGRFWAIVPARPTASFTAAAPRCLFESRDGGPGGARRPLWDDPQAQAAARRRRSLPAHDHAVAGGSRPSGGRGLCGRRLALRGRRRDVAQRQRGDCPNYLPEVTREVAAACRAPDAAPRAPAGAPVHAIPRRRVPLRRRGRELDRHGRGPPSVFGFPLVLDPADPDSAYVIPLSVTRIA